MSPHTSQQLISDGIPALTRFSSLLKNMDIVLKTTIKVAIVMTEMIKLITAFIS
ncbi:MAG: hypothetical protein Faunusvirus16_5 [Faunusvirus sp.]|jgi:hypothetical protein|uniref:Uncharacterized protein n=1 Tax=Faunusvirus sp. TaxID=2487766 RepID=A0A3G4ZZN1_9VIRU|nr:MAG: hypothetical protein Faunusvirus16_5 [Faunusvirus sp.]